MKQLSVSTFLFKICRYKVTSINRFYENNKNQFDAVVLSEVIEHVVNKEKVLEHSIHCLKVYIISELFSILKDLYHIYK